MKKLDKKQIPQFAALCVLSAGLFGYFVLRLVTPSPAAAGTRPAVAVAKPTPAAGTIKPIGDTSAPDKKAAATTDPALAPADGDDAAVPPPTPGMHDPFVVGYVDPKTIPAPTTTPGKPAVQMASLPKSTPAFLSAPAPVSLQGFPVQPLPSAPRLPTAPAAAPLPTAPAPLAPPTWTVTGVLQSDGEQVAILRSGTARRIVRTGDFADSVYRVVAVTRAAVVLRHGTAVYHLLLGAVKDAPAKTAKTASVSEKSLPPATAPALPEAPPSMAQIQSDFKTATEAAKPTNFNF